MDVKLLLFRAIPWTATLWNNKLEASSALFILVSLDRLLKYLS